MVFWEVSKNRLFLQHTFGTLLLNFVNPLSANPTKLSNTLKQFVSKLPTNWLSVFDHFAGLALKVLTDNKYYQVMFWVVFKGSSAV